MKCQEGERWGREAKGVRMRRKVEVGQKRKEGRTSDCDKEIGRKGGVNGRVR